jgi:hypothetical protein
MKMVEGLDEIGKCQKTHFPLEGAIRGRKMKSYLPKMFLQKRETFNRKPPKAPGKSFYCTNS